MPSSTDLAQEIIERVCHDSILADYPAEIVALSVIGSVPALADISQEECQYIFDKLVGAVAARQVARTTIKAVRWLA